MAELLHKHVLWADIGDSLRRVALGFGAAAVIGIPLGLTLGWYPALNQVVNPVMQILRPISPIAWIPVAIVFFGVGERASRLPDLSRSAFFPIIGRLRRAASPMCRPSSAVRGVISVYRLRKSLPGCLSRRASADS